MTTHALNLAGFVETLPGLIGFIPREKFVMSGLQSGRVTLTTCCDLSDVDFKGRAIYAAADRLERSGAESVILCAWTDAQDDETDDLLNIAGDIAHLFGMQTYAAVHVTDSTVRRLHDAADESDTLLPREPAAAAPIRTTPPLDSREELEARIHAGPQARPLPAMPTPSEHAVALAWMTFVIGDDVTPVAEATDEDIATLAAIDHHIELRDAILTSLCPIADTPMPTPTAQARNVTAHMIEVAHRLPDDPASASILGILALTAWRLGEGATANIATERAQRLDPTHTLTGIVRHLLALAIRPPSLD